MQPIDKIAGFKHNAQMYRVNQKPPIEAVASSAEAATAHASSVIDTTQQAASGKELERVMIWRSLGISVGVVLLFVLAVKYKYIKL